MKMKIFLSILAFLIVAVAIVQVKTSSPEYTYTARTLPHTFKQYYENKLAESKKLNVRKNNEERLVRYSNKKTEFAILYIHGYGASRKEGQYVVDRVAKHFKANTYYVRLPGHGTNKEDQENATMKDQLDAAITAFLMVQKLGKRVIVIGTSMGGLLATYLSAYYPDKLAGVVLCSPFYSFNSAVAKMLYFYPMYKLMTTVQPTRIDTAPIPPVKDNWTLYWYKVQKLAAIRQLIDLSNFIDRKDIFKKITGPVLLMYYYKDKEHHDPTASIPHMKAAYKEFGGTTPNPLNREVAVAEGQHVLLSKYVKSDWKAAEKAINDFIAALQKK